MKMFYIVLLSFNSTSLIQEIVETISFRFNHDRIFSIETLLLDTCTDFISWHDAGRYNDTHIAVRTALLHPFISFLGNDLLSLTKIFRYHL
jgi:hypothetical protein